MFSAKIFRNTLLLIILAEALSLLAHFFPALNAFGFALVVLAVLAAGAKRLEYAFFAVLAELLIGSLGKLFSIAAGGQLISIRIALWLALMFLFVFHEARAMLRRIKQNEKWYRFGLFSDKRIGACFFALLLLVAWGGVNGLIRKNGLAAVFTDINGWFYFLLAFPALRVLKSEQARISAASLALASTVWISAKTFILLFIFSHKMTAVARQLYIWVRDTRVGEITDMQNGFYRIFFQSHIFVLAAFLAAALMLGFYFQKSAAGKKRSELASYFFLLTVFLAVILVSFSRSNWVGLAAGLAALFSVSAYLWRLRATIKLFGAMLLVLVFSIALMTAVLKFPFPRATGALSAAELLSERASDVGSEAGASSRWALLPVLWREIRQDPIAGRGFGAAVTYRSSDPRVLEKDPQGLYTTFAFEWGWLDIWLKLGAFGLLAYLALLAMVLEKILKKLSVLKQGFSHADFTAAALGLGLLAIAAVHTFSPYLNHPLGIGFLILALAAALAENGRPAK